MNTVIDRKTAAKACKMPADKILNFINIIEIKAKI